MSILVTGGAGFIGSNFLEFLRGVTDDKIIVLDSLTYASNEENIPQCSQIDFVWCDIVNESHRTICLINIDRVKYFTLLQKVMLIILFLTPIRLSLRILTEQLIFLMQVLR
ncbi:MAG: hypothetical protein CM15mV24_1290 [Bellamyvirus sp.]|nr:MAG: hypothetical protein CM15mV24_1290 [Bellamyvirus sp.]